MRQVRLDPSMQAGFAGAAADAGKLARVGRHEVEGAPTELRPVRPLLSRALRVVRDAAIAVALMATVPIALVGLRAPAFTQMASFSGYVHRSVVRNERWRPLRLASDPTITPLRAGLAFAALQPLRPTIGFPTRPPSATELKTWRDMEIRSDMFAGGTPATTHLPSDKLILQMVSNGLRPAEREFLKRLAAAPAWREFDIVARAPAIDILGGQYTAPIGGDVSPNFRPESYQEIREMATAAVSRAAYHLAIGQRDSAETILRSIISVGFAMIDNSTSAMDEVMGVQIVDVGRVALRQFYSLQHDPRAGTLTPEPRAPIQPETPPDANTFRALQITRTGDARMPRGERFESLNLLSMASCTNIPELVAGPRPDAIAALDKARRDLPRYASERALVGLIENSHGARPPKELKNPISDLAVSAASVAGVAFHNPRFAQCARILTVW